MGKDPETIEREIAETRERMSERVDALSYKADVPSRIGDRVAGARDAIGSRVSELTSGVSERAPDAGEVRRRSRRAAGVLRDNPLGLAVGAAAVGVLVGLLLPPTRAEDETLGDAADAVKSRAAETGQEALDRGRQVAQDVAQTASETARESGRRHAGELAESGRQQAADPAASIREEA